MSSAVPLRSSQPESASRPLCARLGGASGPLRRYRWPRWRRGAGGARQPSGKGGKTTRGTAPSSPDIEELEKFEASEEAKAHEPSDVDAMGQDKRRQVVGHSYGPSRKSQVIFFVVVAAVLVVRHRRLLRSPSPPSTSLPTSTRTRRPGPRLRGPDRRRRAGRGTR